MTIAGTENQPEARVVLSAALKSEEQLSHAYLFHGPPGTGKRSAARAFAAALISHEESEPEDVKRRVLTGVHPDFTWVEPRGAHDILVDDVRNRVIREVALRPFEAGRRVFVIADAERMNEESQNALLKTLEEPSRSAHLVLVSSAPGRLLPTIPSRCQQVRFGPVPATRISELLQEDGVDPALAEACARLAGGNVAKARWLVGEDGAEQRREAEGAARTGIWDALLERAGQRGAEAEEQVKQQVEELLASEPKRGRQGAVKEYELQARRAGRRAHTASLDQSLELVQLWFRDLVAVASGAEEQVLNVDRLAELRQGAEGRNIGSLIACVDLSEETRRRLERNVFEDLALEALFSRLRRLALGA